MKVSALSVIDRLRVKNLIVVTKLQPVHGSVMNQIHLCSEPRS